MDEAPTVYVRTPDYETQIIERLVRMETKLDNLNATITAHEVRIKGLEEKSPHPDHEARLRKLERAIWLATGLAVAGGGALGSVLSHVTGS